MKLKRGDVSAPATRVPVNDHQLYIKIKANRAADVVPGEYNGTGAGAVSNVSNILSKKAVNPCLVASINSARKRTPRKLNTTQPSWNAEILLPLNHGELSQVLVLTVWDKHKRYKNYLGELRLGLADLFYPNGKFQSTTDLKWYKLYSNQDYHSFVTGSLLLSFELVLKKPKKKLGALRIKKATKPSTHVENTNVPGIQIEPPTRNATFLRDDTDPTKSSSAALEESDLYSKLELMEVADSEDTDESDRKEMFESWLKSLILSSNEPSLKPDEQGFYSNLNEEAPTVDISDLESIITTNTNTDISDATAVVASDEFDKASTLNPSDLASISDASNMSSDEPVAELEKSTSTSSTKSKKSRLPKIKSSKKKHNKKFEVGNSNVLGVLFIEILSCSDLPPIKNLTRTSFDMDPFVVVTFGRKTFRTSWKRHNLNPIFNERVAFEILSHERNFNIQFNVLDKEHISFHDKVAAVTMPIRDILEMVDLKKDPDSYMPLGKPEVLGRTNGAQDGTQGDFADNSAVVAEESVSSSANPKSADRSVKIGDGYLSLTANARLAGSHASDSQNSSIQLLEDDNLVQSVRKKKITNRKKVTYEYADTSKFKTMNLSLALEKKSLEDKYKPQLKIRVRFETYDVLRRKFWKSLLEQSSVSEHPESYDYFELISLLDTLGCTDSDDLVGSFFQQYNKSAWGGDLLTHEQIIDSLEKHITQNTNALGFSKVFEIEKCPICLKKRLSKKQDIDIISHFAICTSKDWSIVNKLLVSSYVTPQAATKKWISKFLIKLTYGKYQLGSNSANILVQDRMTGIIMEEKMGVYVRLGIRILYKGLDKMESRRFRTLLKKLSIKQGIKFDNPASKNDIESFIKFHKLDMSEFEEPDPNKYATFNEFFYRRLKPGARVIEGNGQNDSIMTSPADCRCVAFSNVDDATRLWIKGQNFSIAKLFNGNLDGESEDIFKPSLCSLGVFRLAPQDYHRFHSPINGTIGKIKFIEGEYYTVNPMAIRSELDVYGENIRCIIPIHTKEFGTIYMIPIGAMMVGSTVLLVEEGDQVTKGDEVGYFKFGGSTIVLLVESKKFRFDSDLINNSLTSVETLVRMGQSIGHSVDVPQFKRDMIDFDKQSKDFKVNLIRVLTGGDLSDTRVLNNWESSHLKIAGQDIEDVLQDNDEYDDDDSYNEEDEDEEEE